MTSDDLINRLYERFEVAQGSGTVEFVLAELETEPATWRCGVQQLEDRRWAITLTPDLRLYEGVTTVEEYLDRLIDHISPVEPTPVFRSSGLALPEAIDYLNLAWRVHTEHPLFRVPRAEGAAKLAFECQSADEFDSLLSALCGILGRAELPGDGGSKLVDLEEYLESTLGEEAADRAIEAVKDLRAFFDLRAWRQHAGADERGHYAMRRLGLQLPATSWREAWATIQARGVNALNVIREELEGALWIA